MSLPAWGRRDAAVALNNNAVCLLSRCQYDEAMETFKNALDVLRCAFPEQSQQTPTVESEVSPATLAPTAITGIITSEDTQAFLHRASSCLARPCMARDQSLGREQGLEELFLDDSISLEAKVVHVSDEEELSLLHRHDFANYAFRFDNSNRDDYATDDNQDANDLGIEAAAILLNYGIACRCKYQRISRSSTICNSGASGIPPNKIAAPSAFSLLRGASRLYQMALGILSHQCSTQNRNKARKILLHTMLVMQNMTGVCVLLKSRKSQVFYSRLCHLRRKYSLLALVVSSNNADDDDKTLNCSSSDPAPVA
jgi:hypothetical protein